MQFVVSAADKLDLVNPLQGTDSNFKVSYGSTLPLVAVPWGMTNWAPQTNAEWGWWFQYKSKHIQGIRATRQPSPWMGDYGQFLIMPQTGEQVTGPLARQSEYDRDASTFRPDYLKLDLTKYNIGLELTASERCAVLRLEFRTGDTGRLIVDPAETAHVEFVGRTIRGYSTSNSNNDLKHLKAYFVIQLDRDITQSGTFAGLNKDFEKPAEQPGISGWAEFSTEQSRTVIAKIGTSYIGYEQAEQNIKHEVAEGFDAVRQKARDVWEANLDKIDVSGGTADQRQTFFSCLYRAQLFPHKVHELDAVGKPTHYSPFDGNVHPGILYTDNGFWDVYRTNYPFWSILFPEQLGEILHGFINAYKENKWFPQWPSPGDRVSMIGTHVDAVYADAVVKGIKGFDIDTAYEGIRKDAFEVPPRDNVGRPPLTFYLEHGYVPFGPKDHYSASTSLDYAYDDWCVAQVAKALGKTDDYDALMKRSKNYKASWDANVGFFRARDAHGNFAHEPFDEFAWSNGYVEGGPWQCSWAVQHDVDGLAELMGGKQAMGEKLDRLMGLPPVFRRGGYDIVIHEMTEMGQSRFGQYAQSNQPAHHILYLFSAIGQSHKTEYWTRKVCEELYNPGPQGFPGDEDNGEMACWFLMSSMGFYPLCVGDPNYTLTSPLFDSVTMKLSDGKTFTIKSTDNAKHNVYVKSRTLNGKPFTASTISHEQMLAGGEMMMEMSPLV